jgi:nucleotide-binding universal stress UspA family protein
METNKLKFGTIVVATDLGSTASTTLRYAQAIARFQGSTLVIVHVIDPVGYAFPDGAPDFAVADKAARDELRRIEAEKRDEGIQIHSVVETGVICERILQAVCDHHADLLVVGTGAKSRLGKVALGTVARQLVARTPCPILTVSPEANTHLPWAGGGWRRVLVATEFSPISRFALSYAQQIVHEQLVVVHVARCLDEGKCANCRERLRFLAPFNESHTVPVDHVVVSGNAADSIAEQANKLHADLVVLGAPVNELTPDEFHSSTVLQVISQVSCPVLCVRSSSTTSQQEVIEEVACA